MLRLPTASKQQISIQNGGRGRGGGRNSGDLGPLAERLPFRHALAPGQVRGVETPGRQSGAHLVIGEDAELGAFAGDVDLHGKRTSELAGERCDEEGVDSADAAAGDKDEGDRHLPPDDPVHA